MIIPAIAKGFPPTLIWRLFDLRKRHQSKHHRNDSRNRPETSRTPVHIADDHRCERQPWLGCVFRTRYGGGGGCQTPGAIGGRSLARPNRRAHLDRGEATGFLLRWCIDFGFADIGLPVGILGGVSVDQRGAVIGTEANPVSVNCFLHCGQYFIQRSNQFRRLKKYAISIAAFSSESEPWTAFSPTDPPNSF